jgi:ATP-dependent DNA helicase RecG
MTPAEILSMLSLGEGQHREFKSSVRDIDALGAVVCGFLNTEGGYLICGVREHPVAVVGLDLSPEHLARLEKRLHDGLSPKALVSLQLESLDGRHVLVIEVPAGRDVPYAFRDVIYLRDDDGMTRRADAATIRDIVMRRQIEPERWERRFSVADIETDLDRAEVNATVADAQKARRAFFRDPARPGWVLEDLSVAKYGRLTQGGDVLFGANPARHLPQTRVRAMRYRSDKAGDTFDDLQSFEGPLFRVFEKSYDFILRGTPTVARFVPGDPKRHDASLYPEAAVREALINAFAHRDYAASSGGVSIHIFPRRLEIWNSGPLPEGVTDETLSKGQISILRNPDIAHVLYLRGLMEKAGRGSVLMVRQCLDAGLPAPVWRSDPQLGVTVTFHAPPLAEPARHQVPDAVGTKSAPSRHQVAILRKCLADSPLSELMKIAGRTDRTKFRHQVLQSLLDAQWVEMTIPDKPTSSKQRYRLTPLGKAVLNEAAP